MYSLIKGKNKHFYLTFLNQYFYFLFAQVPVLDVQNVNILFSHCEVTRLFTAVLSFWDLQVSPNLSGQRQEPATTD